MITRFPTDLPRLLGAVVGLSVLANGAASLITNEAIGRLSSTASIGYVTVPAAAMVFGGLAFGAGAILRVLFRSPNGVQRTPVLYRIAALALLLGAPILSARAGVATVRRIEAEAEPRVLVTSPRVVREVPEPTASSGPMRAAGKVEDLYSRKPPRPPAGMPALILIRTGAVLQAGARVSETVPLPGLDYVTSGYVVALRSGDAVEAFVTVINGRATGRRAVIAVLSPELKVLYAELVERWWCFNDTPLWAEAERADGLHEAAIVGCKSSEKIRFRLRSPTSG